MNWSWLRIGRRIEWVGVGLFVLGVSLFGYTALRAPNLLTTVILLAWGAMVTLIIELPFILRLRRRRSREALVDSGLPTQSHKQRSRVRLYLSLFFLTLVSATVQVTNDRLVSLAGSILAVYLWNLGLFIAVVGLTQVLVHMKRNRLPSGNP